MSRVNLVGAMGATLSIIGACTFWMYALVTGSTYGSGDTDLVEQTRALLRTLAVVYIAGAVVGSVSQFGALLQIPSLIIGLPVTWYHDFPSEIYVLYLVSFVGTSLLVAAVFLDYSWTRKVFGTPPFSRIRIWTLSCEKVTAPLPKGAAKVILAVLIASTVSAAAFANYSWSSTVSDLRIQVFLDGRVYGNGNISISVDGERVHEEYVSYDPWEYYMLQVETTFGTSAGSHLIEVDAWNGAVLAEGDVDIHKEVKVLPFTTEEAALGLGVWFS